MVCQTDIGHVMCDAPEGCIVDFHHNIVYRLKGVFQIRHFHSCFTRYFNFFIQMLFRFSFEILFSSCLPFLNQSYRISITGGYLNCFLFWNYDIAQKSQVVKL